MPQMTSVSCVGFLRDSIGRCSCKIRTGMMAHMKLAFAALLVINGRNLRKKPIVDEALLYFW